MLMINTLRIICLIKIKCRKYIHRISLSFSLVIKQVPKYFYKVHGLYYISLRYYIVIGIDMEQGVSEVYQPETQCYYIYDIKWNSSFL